MFSHEIQWSYKLATYLCSILYIIKVKINVYAFKTTSVHPVETKHILLSFPHLST